MTTREELQQELEAMFPTAHEFMSDHGMIDEITSAWRKKLQSCDGTMTVEETKAYLLPLVDELVKELDETLLEEYLDGMQEVRLKKQELEDDREDHENGCASVRADLDKLRPIPPKTTR